MTQQEIYQNMTKGEWYVENVDGDNYISTECASICRLEYDYDEVPTIGKDYTAAAIVSAVNLWQNLVSNGINPELVPHLWDLLSEVVNTFEVTPNSAFAESEKDLLERAKEAINAAKL